MKITQARKDLVDKYLKDKKLIPMTREETTLRCMDICEPEVIWWIGEKDSPFTLHLGSTMMDGELVQISVMGVPTEDEFDGSVSELCLFEESPATIEAAIEMAYELYEVELVIDGRFIKMWNEYKEEE